MPLSVDRQEAISGVVGLALARVEGCRGDGDAANHYYVLGIRRLRRSENEDTVIVLDVGRD